MNLPTIFFTNAEPFETDVKLLGRTVHLSIKPVRFEWSVGQGGALVTDWPGRPYGEGVDPQTHPDEYVTWTYRHHAARESVAVKVVWGATYSVGRGPEHSVPGTVQMTSPPQSLQVAEARGVLTAE